MNLREFVCILMGTSVAVHFLCFLFTGVPGFNLEHVRDSCTNPVNIAWAGFIVELISLAISFSLMRLSQRKTRWCDTVFLEVAGFVLAIFAVGFSWVQHERIPPHAGFIDLIVNYFDVVLNVLSFVVMMIRPCCDCFEF